MERRSISGWIIVVIGIILFIEAFEEFFVGLIFVLVGLVIVLNKGEDIVEQIKFKGGKKSDKK